MTTSVISRTGRVQSWMDDPTSRLPVSCTVFVVQDSMEGPDGIEASWRFTSHALRHGAGCAVHLSELRPKGAENGKGLVASGPVSFAKIYSTLNEILRRGGVYKNGAVVCHLDLCHNDALEFITTPRHELPWVKRCINITEGWWRSCTFKEQLLQSIKAGDVWLNKVKYDNEGNRIGVTCVWKCTCPHEEHACCSTSLWVPVSSTKSQELLFRACRSCVPSMLKLALAIQESIYHQKQTDKSDSECSDWQISYGGTE